MHSAAPGAIELRGISKRFGGITALHPLDLDLRRGEVHAVCGENGAGKSTLNRVLCGGIEPDSGVILIDGREHKSGSVAAAESAGIVMVHQESTAFLHLTSTENHELMREPTAFGGLWLDRGAMSRETRESLQALGESFDTETPLAELSLAQRQMTSIARAVSRDCRLLILDEPTASLSSKETSALFEAVRRARHRGACVLYVSHRLEEVFELSDRVSVLRDGRLVATLNTSETTRSDLIRHMVGREVEFSCRDTCSLDETLLEVRSIGREGAFGNVSFQVRQGEVLGIAGLVGAGRSEIARCIFGLERADTGTIATKGRVALVPEDRQHEGLHLDMTIRDNLMLARTGGTWISRQEETRRADEIVARLAIKATSVEAEVSSLSGGNQQKTALGKWLATEPDILILDEPTRGVDVGAKSQIHDHIDQLAKQGKAVIVISSELGEVLALSDRVLTLREGTVSGELQRSEVTQETVLEKILPLGAASVVSRKRGLGLSRELMVGALLVLLVAIVAAVNPSFLSLANAKDILIKIAPTLIVGSAMTLLILAREIDISVGSLMGLCAAVMGIACAPDRMGLPVAVGVVACVGVGALCGLLNGLLVGFVRAPSIMVTLGMMTVLRGVTELLMQGKWIERLPTGLRTFGTGGISGIPWSIIVGFGAILLAVWVTRRTRFGLRTYALGSNPNAASLIGMRVDLLRAGLFTLVGFSAGLAALISATQLQVVESGFGQGFELVVIASVVIGGTSILGGRGSVIGTLVGVLLLGTVSTALIFLKLGESATYWERAIQGALILLAVLADWWSRKDRGAA